MQKKTLLLFQFCSLPMSWCSCRLKESLLCMTALVLSIYRHTSRHRSWYLSGPTCLSSLEMIKEINTNYQNHHSPFLNLSLIYYPLFSYVTYLHIALKIRTSLSTKCPNSMDFLWCSMMAANLPRIMAALRAGSG